MSLLVRVLPARPNLNPADPFLAAAFFAARFFAGKLFSFEEKSRSRRVATRRLGRKSRGAAFFYGIRAYKTSPFCIEPCEFGGKTTVGSPTQAVKRRVRALRRRRQRAAAADA